MFDVRAPQKATDDLVPGPVQAVKQRAGPVRSMTTNGVSTSSSSSSSSSTAAAAASKTQDYLENGRLYHGFRKGMYLFPCDEAEKDRMDIYHQMFLVARHDRLHHAGFDENAEGTRILDLGTGTGIWAIDIADQFPKAEVVGLDLVNIQPSTIPRNLRFKVPSDVEAPSWYVGEDSWDLIHVRQACGSVSGWRELYQKIFIHLKSGTGCLEHVEVDLKPRCDDGSLEYEPMQYWYELLRNATAEASRPIEYPDPREIRQMLQENGFIDIREQIIRAPYNTWSKNPHERAIGRWNCVATKEGLEALSMAPFTRVLGWKASEVKFLTDRVKEVIVNRKVHAYNNIHVWTARKP